jgi:hypothetical protein
MATDFTKAPKDILVDLINETNGTALAPVDLELGEVTPLPIVPLPGQDAPPVTLACILAQPGVDSVFRGETLLMYRRIHVAKALLGLPPFVAARGSAEKVSQLLPQINARFGYNILPEDVVDADLEPSVDAEEEVPFTLTIAPDSLIYVGAIGFVVVGETPIRLDVAVTETQLPPFEPLPVIELFDLSLDGFNQPV